MRASPAVLTGLVWLVVTATYAGLIVIGSFGPTLRVLTTFGVIAVFLVAAYVCYWFIFDAEGPFDEPRRQREIMTLTPAVLIGTLITGVLVGVLLSV